MNNNTKRAKIVAIRQLSKRLTEQGLLALQGGWVSRRALRRNARRRVRRVPAGNGVMIALYPEPQPTP